MVIPKVSSPVGQLSELVQSNAHVGKRLNYEVLQFLGVFVLKCAFEQTTIEQYAAAYFQDLNGPDLRRTPFHLTEVKIQAQNRLNDIVAEAEFRAIAAQFFGGNVGVDFVRIVKKDKTNFQPVFLHQDTAYQMGGFERYSFFIPLTHCCFSNGGLVVYPGTHHFGYLADAGEISQGMPVPVHST